MAGLERAVEAQRQVLGLVELLDPGDVGDRRARHPVGPVAGGERVAVAPEQRRAALLAVLLDERLLEVVAPRARGGHQQRLDLALVHVGQRPGLDVGEEVQAHQHGLGDARRVVDAGRAGRLAQDPLDAVAVLGVEAVARHEHQAREEAVEGVAADEQAQPLARAQVQDPHADPVEVVDRDLEQLVAREALEDLDQGLLVVALGGERRALAHGLDLAPQDRYLARARLVGGVRVEPEEAPLAGHVAVGVEALDADVVEIGRAVDRRARVRLGQVDQVGLERPRADRRRQPLEAVRARLAALLAQDAERGLGPRHERELARLAAQLVLAVAQEDEVVVLEPGQEGARLGDLVAVERRRVGAQLSDDVERLRPDRLPVGDRRAHLVDHAHQVVPELLELPGVGLARDLRVDHRLGERAVGLGAVGEHLEQLALGVAAHLDDRVDDHEHPEAAPVELHAERIDQERHVVGHDLDGGVRGLPAVDLELGVVDAQLGGPRLALAGQVEVREGGPVQVQVAPLGDVLGRDPAVVLARERLRPARVVPVQVLSETRADGIDQRLVDIQRLLHGPWASLRPLGGAAGGL